MNVQINYSDFLIILFNKNRLVTTQRRASPGESRCWDDLAQEFSWKPEDDWKKEKKKHWNAHDMLSHEIFGAVVQFACTTSYVMLLMSKIKAINLPSDSPTRGCRMHLMIESLTTGRCLTWTYVDTSWRSTWAWKNNYSSITKDS